MIRRLFLSWWRPWRARRQTVAVLRLNGVIATGSRFRSGINLAGLSSDLDRAYKLRNLKAVALTINSPGGSPVQSALIATRRRTLADKKGIPVFAFAEDVAASGGYWLACSADEIFADQNSIIGSIGVIYASFGFQGLLKWLGIERRTYTRGDDKLMLDPFLEEDPDDVSRLQALQTDVHDSFKAYVRERRGVKLKGEDGQLFNGQVWTGRKAVELGLVDGVGDLHSVMRQRYGDGVKLHVINRRRGWFSRGLALPVNIPNGTWIEDLIMAVETREYWRRFGL